MAPRTTTYRAQGELRQLKDWTGNYSADDFIGHSQIITKLVEEFRKKSKTMEKVADEIKARKAKRLAANLPPEEEYHVGHVISGTLAVLVVASIYENVTKAELFAAWESINVSVESAITNKAKSSAEQKAAKAFRTALMGEPVKMENIKFKGMNIQQLADPKLVLGQNPAKDLEITGDEVRQAFFDTLLDQPFGFEALIKTITKMIQSTARVRTGNLRDSIISNLSVLRGEAFMDWQFNAADVTTKGPEPYAYKYLDQTGNFWNSKTKESIDIIIEKAIEEYMYEERGWRRNVPPSFLHEFLTLTIGAPNMAERRLFS